MKFADDDPTIAIAKQLIDEAIKLIATNFPAMKEIGMEVIETIFAPKTVMKQLLIATILETGVITVQQLRYLLQDVPTIYSTKARLIRKLQRQQNQTETQDEWMDLAERIDHIQGNDLWRSNPECFLYERDRISARIDEFIHLMRRRDIFDLMFTLRGGIARNKFGLLHEGLFSRAMAGSKILVETYHSVVCAALDFACDSPVPPDEDPIPTDARLAFFNETRHSYGRTALLLSGGAGLGFYHVGVVKALMENGLLPRVLGCSSAGSIVGAMIATRTDEECVNDLFDVRGTTSPGHSGGLYLNFFRGLGKGPAPENACIPKSDLGEVLSSGAFKDPKRTWQLFMPNGVRQATSVIYDILRGRRRPQDILMNDTNHLRECIRLNVGNFTFQEAFDRTGRILNITVTPQNKSDPPRLLNYLTAPHVLVWSASVASSSLPGVFEANKLMVKDADGTIRYESASAQDFSDGSMEVDLPMQQLSEMFNINHFIVSQANPHAVMFAGYNAKNSVWTNSVTGLLHGVLVFLKNQCRTWLSHFVKLVGGRRIAPMFDTSRGLSVEVFTQEYEGRNCDISLIPWMGHRSLMSAFLHVIYNPSEPEFRDWVRAAERETWKHLPAIKSHCAEEMTLDRCVQRLRKRLNQESWEKARISSKQLEKMPSRVPSFFTSRSLVNLGGLGVGDELNIDFEQARKNENRDPIHQDNASNPAISDLGPETEYNIDYNQGWGGMGLRGNHSLASLNSHTSGFFLEDEMDDVDEEENHTAQVAGEQSTTASKMCRSGSKSSTGQLSSDGYVKTTTMANFYYRKTSSSTMLKDTSDPSFTSSKSIKRTSASEHNLREDLHRQSTVKLENRGNLQDC